MFHGINLRNKRHHLLPTPFAFWHIIILNPVRSPTQFCSPAVMLVMRNVVANWVGILAFIHSRESDSEFR